MAAKGDRKIINGTTFYYTGTGWEAISPKNARRRQAVTAAASTDRRLGGEADWPVSKPSRPPVASDPAAPTTPSAPPPLVPDDEFTPPSQRRKPLPKYYKRNPWTRNPVTEQNAVYQLQQEMSLGAEDVHPVVSSGAKARARAQATEEAELQREREEHGVTATPEQEEQRDLDRRQRRHEQESGWREDERQRQVQEFRRNVDSAMEFADTVQLPEGSLAWSVQNDIRQAYGDLQELRKYAEHGGDTAKLRGRMAETRNRIVSGATKLADIQAQAAELSEAEGRTQEIELERDEIALEKDKNAAAAAEKALERKEVEAQKVLLRTDAKVTREIFGATVKELKAAKSTLDAAIVTNLTDQTKMTKDLIPKEGATPEQLAANTSVKTALGTLKGLGAEMETERDRIKGELETAESDWTAARATERKLYGIDVEGRTPEEGANREPQKAAQPSRDEFVRSTSQWPLRLAGLTAPWDKTKQEQIAETALPRTTSKDFLGF